MLLDAFEGLERDAVLWVAGDGPETDALRRRGVPGVEWVGRISEEEKARRLRAATVFCAPALGGESFGIVLLEGMAASTAVVASDIDGFRNVARADRDALLVEPSDAGALRDALRRALDDPSHRAELIASGEQRALEFSMRHVAERFAGVAPLVRTWPPGADESDVVATLAHLNDLRDRGLVTMSSDRPVRWGPR